MNIWASILVGLNEILAHKFRSFLTMFGIIMGVASLVATFATVEGMTRGQRENLVQSGGIERISVSEQEVPPGQEDRISLSPGRTLADVEIIKKECPLVIDISPEVNLNNPTVQFLNKMARPRGLAGVTPSFTSVNNYEVEFGRFICDVDLEAHANVCVIGWPVWEALEQSRSDSPVGKTIKINDIPFLVVGVLRDYESVAERKFRESGKLEARMKRAEEQRSSRRSRDSRSWNSAAWRNNLIQIPLSTMQSVYKSASLDLGFEQRGKDERLSFLHMKISDSTRIPEAIDQVKAALLKTHRGVEDFGFDTRENWADDIESTVKASKLSGGIMSGISLLIGGIGIANIMLASITERVREIGIRLAVGARSRAIFLQILIESSVLGFMGGVIGLFASFGLVELIKKVVDLSYEPIIVADGMIVGLTFSVLTGICAGIYPALRASRLDPIQALRYE
jgi:putative ABC transport system permease protein